MQLQRLYLKNIRSYVEQELLLPEGKILLSGDIGAGKTTVLMAIEFAFFGTKRGELSGDALLRKGEKEGIVRLEFVLGGKNYAVERKLKRAKGGVEQSTGAILVDGVAKELTAMEMRAFLLDLLGYPKDLLAKSKDLIYRYTVFCPQEEMKSILADDNEARLETLRKIFGIEKYKKVRDNLSFVVREIRTRQQIIEGVLEALPQKEKIIEEKKEQEGKITANIEEINKNLLRQKEITKKQQAIFEEWQKQWQFLVEKNKEKEGTLALLQQSKKRVVANSDEIAYIRKKIEEMQKEQPLPKKEQLLLLEKEIASFKLPSLDIIQNEIVELSAKIKEQETAILNSTKQINSISSLKDCPLCLQKVDSSHKEHISKTEQKKIEDAKKAINELAAAYKQKQEAFLEAKKLHEKHQEKRVLLEKLRAEARLQEQKIKQIEEYKKRLSLLENEEKELKRHISDLEAKLIQQEKLIEKLPTVEKLLVQAKNDFEQSQQMLRKVEIELASLEKERMMIAKELAELQKETALLNAKKQELQRIQILRQWLEEFLPELTYTLERTVFLRLYNEFNLLFKEWFSLLLEDETMNVRIDDSFAPVIEQNGHEIMFEHLSGGERTSCALSYRLALNKVVNDLVPTINTKDIIILDEPTDGFSAAQLDKIRDVLDNLGMKQTIIVSHEPKIESFVDHVVRIAKQGHSSTVF